MRITFCGPLVSTFVSNDVEILSRKFELDAIDAKIGKGGEAIVNLIKLHLRIISSLFKSDALFFWFADYYTLIPTLVARLLGKPVFVVAGGFDITYLPELGIGARAKPARWFAVRHTFRYCTHIFPVSQDTQNDLDDAVPDHKPSTMIYNAVRTAIYHFRNDLPRTNILTVSQADSIPEFTRKGLDKVIEIARMMPHLPFRVIGLRGAGFDEAKRLSDGLSNVTVLPGRIPLDDLLVDFWQAKIYLQPSIEERFGVSVAEAMSCGCIPIVAPVNALKEVVGNAGVIIPREDLAQWCEMIEQKLSAEEAEHIAASSKAKQFDIDERARQLLGVVDQVLARH
jgi:glycosyltransferase involved in cell wall biosynthesis